MHLTSGRALLPLLSAALTPPRSRALCMNGGFGATSLKDTFKYSGRVRPGKLSPRRTVPAGIPRPDYWKDGQPKARGSLLPWQIEVKSEADIAGMRAAGRIAREVLDLAGNALRVGIATDEIDALVHEATIARGAYPSPLNYHGFPKSCCTSINEVICHGIPDSSRLREGAICNIDVTCYFGGFHGDCSETFLVGEVDEAGKRLVKATYDAWQAAIAYCGPGKEYKVSPFLSPHPC
jgi:methionyl aminopeptidase